MINLDHRPDRLAFMAAQLDGFGLRWQKLRAVDARTTSDEVIYREIDARPPLIRMSRGSQCCTLSHFEAWRLIAEGTADGAIILEDDGELAPSLALMARKSNWLPADVDVVQLGRKSGSGAKLLGPRLALTEDGREIRRLFSRVGGSGAYFVTREAARRLLASKAKCRVSIDHLLFNANVSALARGLRLAVVTPAIASQRTEDFTSDITPTQPKSSLWRRLVRGWLEINSLPQQLFLVVTGQARPIRFQFQKTNVVPHSGPGAKLA